MQALHCVVPQSFYPGKFTSGIEFDFFWLLFFFCLIKFTGMTLVNGVM